MTTPEKKISPLVINSKAAQNHLNEIKARHSELVQDMQSHAEKVAQFNKEKDAQRKIDMQQERDNQMAIEKQKMEANAKTMELNNKSRELDIKEKALSL